MCVDRFGIQLGRADQSLRAADRREGQDRRFQRRPVEVEAARLIAARIARIDHQVVDRLVRQDRSEEHTSELQSLMRISYAVFCLKKKKQEKKNNQYYNQIRDGIKLHNHKQ